MASNDWPVNFKMVDSIKNIASGSKFQITNFEKPNYVAKESQKLTDNNINSKISRKDIAAYETEPSKGIQEFESKLNEFLKDENLTLEFKQDDDTKKMIMKLIDNETEEVIKQFPEEVSLQIAKMVSTILEKKDITNIKV